MRLLRLANAALLMLLLAAAAPLDKPAGMSDDAYALLRAAIDVLKVHHIDRNSVDWPGLEAQALAMVPSAQKPHDVLPAIHFLIAALGERHTFLLGPNHWSAMTSGATADPALAAALLRLPTAKVLGGIGYILVPGHDGAQSDDKAYVITLRDALRHFQALGICRFVVDFRGNAGGNMFPMMAGLESLLGRRPYGYWDSGEGIVKPWLDPDTMIRMDGLPPPDYGPLPADRSSAAVAVLIDRRTASSGELTAIAFEGRPRTQFFGEPSFGLTTGNVAFTLPDNMHIAVTTVKALDRRHHTYRVAVVPDIETEPGAATDRAALAWLRRQPCAK